MHRDPTANSAMNHFVREERRRVPVVREARRKHGMAYGMAYASEEEVRRFVEMVEKLPGMHYGG